ncbi:hypothetical protein EST38_g10604 [Candolleomyces aberdarensis]|uniref:Heme peroxidase n=1 Tax=Candolleomyces aberdarensis TaxID=2316362 RepID=A0A4Q2D9U2_9AGAR|nr:hypothetical protein EST38_g10604 [Candolleomyces aberdarensis]
MSLLSKLYGKAKDAKDAKSDDKPDALWHPSTDWYDGPTGQALKDIVETLLLSLRPAPEALDGYYDNQLDAKTDSRDRNIVAKLNDLLAPYVSTEAKPAISAKITALVDKIIHPQAENDRLGFFEDLLSVLSMAPPDSKAGRLLANKAVGVLYNAIPHPVDTLLDKDYTFRQADGGKNNIHVHSVGQAGQPYARSVQPKKSIHPSTLPDPELIFEHLLKARDRVDHAGGNSALTFAFASLVTHSLFKTRISNLWINDASSYLDLSPLYGNNAEEVKAIREPSSGGRGLIYPDTFADAGLPFLPPAVGALIILFNRNHNYIAGQLLKLNEKKKWSPYPISDAAKAMQQDDEIFETARLVNCGHFISMIMNDYVSGFLGLSEGNAWSINAFDPIKLVNGTKVQRGEGNHVSVEFNLLYRWHTTTSARDEEWTKDFFTGPASPLFPNKDMEQVSVPELIGGLGSYITAAAKTPPHKRAFAGLSRGPDGKFNSDDLARILQDATESPAGQYRARGTPAVLKPIEMLGINQARRWGVCTMNEFRAWLGLKQFDSFEEWNPDKEIANAARDLYGHVDNLELYVGLQCEQHMPLSPGLRFSCGYTMTRAVLSDAIALIRGDRFYTTSFTPETLTTWGFHDATTRPDSGGLGAHLPKLLMRHFPRHYPFNNVYGIFPFFTPKKMKESLERQGVLTKNPPNYVFDRPAAPGGIPKFIDTFEAINVVFNDPTKFVSGYNLSGLGDGYGFMMAIDKVPQHDRDKAMAVNATVGPKPQFDGYVQWFKETTQKELKEQTFRVGKTNYVDVWQLVKTVHTYWAADQLCGIPLKTKENPRGKYTVNEVFDYFCDLFTASFLGLGDTERFWELLQKARKASDVIQGATRESVIRVGPGLDDPKGKSDPYRVGVLKGWAREIQDYYCPPEDLGWWQFISRLTASKRPVNELVANIVGLANGSSVNQAHTALNVIDFYLEDSRKENLKDILKLIAKNDADSNKRLRGYIREAMRLNPQFTGLWRVATVETEVPGVGKVKPGERIWGGFKKAHLNPMDFPNPTTVDPTRDPSKYQLNGGGFHLCIGVDFAIDVIAEILKIILPLKGLRRGPGDSGRLVKTTKIFNLVETNQYVKPDGSLSDWPQSMKIAWDD